jgi:hypothetical protein
MPHFGVAPASFNDAAAMPAATNPTAHDPQLYAPPEGPPRPVAPQYKRDLVGYGRRPPHPQWPGGARIALNFVINYEEVRSRRAPRREFLMRRIHLRRRSRGCFSRYHCAPRFQARAGQGLLWPFSLRGAV